MRDVSSREVVLTVVGDRRGTDRYGLLGEFDMTFREPALRQ